MIEIEIALQYNADFSALESRIEQLCAERGLLLKLKTGLAKFPGCKHWHYGRIDVKGTLEFTIWAKSGRCWITIHSGRYAEWVETAANELKIALESPYAG